MSRELREALANILGECSAHADRYGPEAKAAFERIREWAQKAVGTGTTDPRCRDCCGTGIFECVEDGSDSWPCRECNEAACAEWERATGKSHGTTAEVRAWLDARAKAATVASADPHRTHSRGLLTMGDSGATCLGEGCGVRDEQKPDAAGRGAA